MCKDKAARHPFCPEVEKLLSDNNMLIEHKEAGSSSWGCNEEGFFPITYQRHLWYVASLELLRNNVAHPNNAHCFTK